MAQKKKSALAVSVHRLLYQPNLRMTQIKEKYKTSLSKYLPGASVNYIVELIFQYHIQLTITAARKTKFGDYRAPLNGKGHRISVNGNLNPYAFLITLIHEIAHLQNWEQYHHRVKPHGEEWKICFVSLMQPLLNETVFPENLLPALFCYFENPKASSTSDINLMKALSIYNTNTSDVLLLEDIPEKSLFLFQNHRVFEKGVQLRKRFRCKEVATNKIYLFSPVAVVELVES